MRRVMFLLILALAVAVPLLAQAPVVYSVDPTEAKRGATVSAGGVNLESAYVSAVYLTDGVNDIKLTLVEQKTDTLKVKIPADAKPGTYNLMLSTKQKPPVLLVQPVKFTIVREGGEE